MTINTAEHREDRPWLEQTDLLGSISQVLLARKWSIIGITLLTFALTMLGTWLAQPVYTSSASILLKKERFDAPVTPEQTLVTGQPDRHLTEEEINSEVEILNSPSLLEEVARREHLDQEFEQRQENPLLAPLKQLLNENLTPQARAQIQLRNNLIIESVNLLEGIVFLTNSQVEWGEIFLHALISAALIVPVWMLLFGRRTDVPQEHSHPIASNSQSAAQRNLRTSSRDSRHTTTTHQET